MHVRDLVEEFCHIYHFHLCFYAVQKQFKNYVQELEARRIKLIK